MNTTTLRKELCDYINAIPDYRLEILKPLLVDMSEPNLIIETGLTDEEYALIDDTMKRYKENPSSFVTLEEMKRCRLVSKHANQIY